MTVHRFQLDMTKEELESLERLGQLASLRTKKEVIASALTLFKWATREILYGRSICSIDEATGKTKQFESPALSNLADAAARIPRLTPEEYAQRLKESARPAAEVLAELKGVNRVGSEILDPGGLGVGGATEQCPG